MAQAFLIGRILAGGAYLLMAYHHFANASGLARAAAAHGVPAPTLAVLFGGVLLLVGGLSLLLGMFPRLGVAALLLFLVPVTLIMHTDDFVNVSKNVGLIGSALMLLGVPRPWPYSVERRLRLPVRAPV